MWIFEFQELDFSHFQLQKIQYELGKNPVHQTRYFKLENFKNQVQIDRGTDF